MNTVAIERTTVAVAAGHLALAVLIATGRAGYTVDPDGVVGTMAEHWAWVPIHAVLGVLILASVVLQHNRMLVMALSSGALFWWSLLMGSWAVQLEPDATWAVAILGLAFSAVAFGMSGLWADRE